MEHATPSAGDTLANVSGAEKAHEGPDSHAVQELGSPGAEQNPPSGTDSPDRGVPAVQSGAEAAPVDSSAAIYQPASPTNEDSVAETVPHEWRAAGNKQGSEEQGHEEQGPDHGEDVQQQQPGVPAHSANYCIACLSFPQAM